MPTVSIITPCYNQERFVAKTLESVQAQTFEDWEQIVVDDGSVDGSAAIVEEYAGSDPRIRLIRQENGGVANARNNGYRAISASSRYLYFLDPDDCLEPEMLSVMTSWLDTHPDVGLAYCHVRIIDEHDHLLPVDPHEIGWAPRYVPAGLGVGQLRDDQPETPFVTLFSLTTIIPSVSVLRRSIYERTPGFDEAFGHVFEDADLFLQMALYSKVHRLAQPLVRYRRHGAQSTAGIHEGRYGKQEHKLYTKWKEMAGLTPQQQEIVQAAFRFREGRLLPYQGLNAGHRRLRQGRIVDATRFYLGAAKRYFGSFLL